MSDLRDRYGLPYILTEEVGAMYVSPCCQAGVTIYTDDGSTICKKCCSDVDPMLGGIPEIDSESPEGLMAALAKAGLESRQDDKWIRVAKDGAPWFSINREDPEEIVQPDHVWLLWYHFDGTPENCKLITGDEFEALTTEQVVGSIEGAR